MPPSKKKPAKAIRILLVDDHPIVREGLAQLIGREPDMQVVADAESVSEGLRKAAEHKPDMAIVDLTIKDGSGLELIKDLRLRHRQMRILVLSMHDENIYAERALKAGAHGYVMKDQARAELATAIRTVAAGQVHLSARMSQSILSRIGSGPSALESPVAALTDREMQILRLSGQGLSARLVAEQLHRSVKTIDAHRENMKRKLGLASNADLLQFAIKWVQSEQ